MQKLRVYSFAYNRSLSSYVKTKHSACAAVEFPSVTSMQFASHFLRIRSCSQPCHRRFSCPHPSWVIMVRVPSGWRFRIVFVFVYPFSLNPFHFVHNPFRFVLLGETDPFHVWRFFADPFHPIRCLFSSLIFLEHPLFHVLISETSHGTRLDWDLRCALRISRLDLYDHDLRHASPLHWQLLVCQNGHGIPDQKWQIPRMVMSW